MAVMVFNLGSGNLEVSILKADAGNGYQKLGGENNTQVGADQWSENLLSLCYENLGLAFNRADASLEQMTSMERYTNELNEFGYVNIVFTDNAGVQHNTEVAIEEFLQNSEHLMQEALGIADTTFRTVLASHPDETLETIYLAGYAPGVPSIVRSMKRCFPKVKVAVADLDSEVVRCTEQPVGQTETCNQDDSAAPEPAFERNIPDGISYVSAIAVDFGSANSGCCRVCEHDADGNLVFSNPEFLHNIGDYAKDSTWFYVEESFLMRLITEYDSIADEDFRVASRIFPNTADPNIICGKEAIRNYFRMVENGGWRSFSRFKMLLYRSDGDFSGLGYPLHMVIKIYLRILKQECLYLESNRLGRQVAADEILWGLTIPSIWTPSNKKLMSRIVTEVFGRQARILSEPEGPLVYSLLSASIQGRPEYVDGRVSLVVDVGGGTTDICVMKEVASPDGHDCRFEMVANTEGTAAGGNDIDEAFFVYLLRDLSAGLVSDSGASYDSMTDEQLTDTLLTGFKCDVESWIAMEDSWIRHIKNRSDFNSIEECPFALDADYRKWLLSSGHKAVAKRVAEYLLDGCSFDKTTLIEKVFNPTFDKICTKIDDVISKLPDGVAINRVVLAGGLSCNYLLKARMRNTLKNALGDQITDSIYDMGVLMSGGAIAAGACYMLLNKGAVVRIATWDRNYFYDACVPDITKYLLEKYELFKCDLTEDQLDAYIDAESQYRIDVGDLGTVVLSPIALKDRLVKDYVNDGLYTGANQSVIRMKIYSSDKPVVIYPNCSNTDLHVEREISIDCMPRTRYKLEVDFNEATISNALHYRMTEFRTGNVVAEDMIDDAFSYTEQDL